MSMLSGIDLGALAVGLGRACMSEWAMASQTPPVSAEDLRRRCLAHREAHCWLVLEDGATALEIGNEDLVYWFFRQTVDRSTRVRLGVSRPEVGAAPWWEVVLEGPWGAAEVVSVRVAPFAMTWLKEDARRIGLLGQLWGDGMRDGGTPWGMAARRLVDQVEEWSINASEGNGAVLASFARWDGLAGAGAMLRDPIDLEDRIAVARRRAAVRKFLQADGFLNSGVWNPDAK